MKLKGTWNLHGFSIPMWRKGNFYSRSRGWIGVCHTPNHGLYTWIGQEKGDDPRPIKLEFSVGNRRVAFDYDLVGKSDADIWRQVQRCWIATEVHNLFRANTLNPVFRGDAWDGVRLWLAGGKRSDGQPPEVGARTYYAFTDMASRIVQTWLNEEVDDLPQKPVPVVFTFPKGLEPL